MKQAKTSLKEGASFMPEAGAELTVTMTDITTAGFCARGARRFFEEHELDFRGFLKQGIDAQTLLETGDARAIKTVEGKIEREWLATDLEGLTITVDDLKASRKCNAGARKIASREQIDWSNFIEDGISAKRLLATGDRDALKVIRDKLERARG
jgi:hypothetical protein